VPDAFKIRNVTHGIMRNVSNFCGVISIWDKTPCLLVEFTNFGRTCCIRRQDRRVPWRWRQQMPPKHV